MEAMTQGHVMLRKPWHGRDVKVSNGLGFLFGVLAGMTLVVFAWGFDGLALARAHALLPWAKLLFGAGCIVVPLGLLGWASLWLRHALLTGVIWLVAGAVSGWLAAQVSFRVYPLILTCWVPDTVRLVDYEWSHGPAARAILCSLFCGLMFFVAGLLARDLLEGWNKGHYAAGRVFSIVLWVGCFALSGASVDYLAGKPLRDPIVVLEELVAFRLSHPGWRDLPQARTLHASVLNPAATVLSRRHRLAVAGFDETVFTIRVLVDFEGEWIECTLIGSDPVFCRSID